MTETAAIRPVGGILDVLRILNKIRALMSDVEWQQWLPRILELMRLPDWGDEDALKEWLGKVLEVAQVIAAKTTTPVDETLLSVLEFVMKSDAAWDLLWSILHGFVSTPVEGLAAEDVGALAHAIRAVQ